MRGSAKPIFLVAVVAAIITAPAALQAQAPAPQGPLAAVAGDPERITVTVTGLSCPFCAYGLEKRFRTIRGLDSLTIGFQTGAVMLYVRDGAAASDERIRELVKAGGFEVTRIERARWTPAS